jgi:acyl-CoA synthetase (AMP-forming)/AMP-acid ligase II
MEFNIADLFERVADTIPDREALVFEGRAVTFGELDERATRLAHHLADRGIGPGDHVAVYLYNSPHYLETMLAAFKLRAVPINVNYRYGDAELRYLLADGDARAVVFHAEFSAPLAAALPALPLLATAVRVEDGNPAVPLGTVTTTEYDAALASARAERDFGPRSADDLYVLYTGGTTGMPKGVMWRHEDLFFAALGGGGGASGQVVTAPEEIATRARDARPLRCLPACPFMHGTAHWMALGALLTGGTVVISADRHLDPVRLWQLVARERVRVLVIVGDAFARPLVEALDAPALEGVDLSCCAVIVSGGAILSPAVKTALAEGLPGSVVVDGYGASETGGQGQSVTTAGTEPSSVPRFTVNDETTVLTDDLRPASVGVVGRLARRGHIPLGYYRDPEKSAETFPEVDGVRWSVPGDHARIEEDGSITLLGRGSVSINTGGEKVYPEEVEAALKGHPGVFDAVVVGVADDRWGERVVAVVQPRPGCPVDQGDLARHVRGRLASYKAPRAVVAVERIERSPSGKPDYRWARTVAEGARESSAGSVSP